MLLSALPICANRDPRLHFACLPPLRLFSSHPLPATPCIRNEACRENGARRRHSSCQMIGPLQGENLSLARSTSPFCSSPDETHAPLQFLLSPVLKLYSRVLFPSLIPYTRYLLFRAKRMHGLSRFSLPFWRDTLLPPSPDSLILAPPPPPPMKCVPSLFLSPFSAFQRACAFSSLDRAYLSLSPPPLSLSLSLSPFPFESSFTHAHRGRDHVFHTRVRVRAFARARSRSAVCVRAKIPRFSTESVESHLLLFPTRSLCPPPASSTCISTILGRLGP